MITSDSGKSLSPAAGQEFLTLIMTARNIGRETALLPPPRLAGPDGKLYDASMTIDAADDAAGLSLAPGARHVCRFTFEVPGRTSYKAVVAGGWLSSRFAAVDIPR